MEEFGDLSGAMLWRRKFLLPDPTSRRPAYFGSWRKTRYCTSPLAHLNTTPLVYQYLLETMTSGFFGLLHDLEQSLPAAALLSGGRMGF